jgi:hypothetical protein
LKGLILEPDSAAMLAEFARAEINFKLVEAQN